MNELGERRRIVVPKLDDAAREYGLGDVHHLVPALKTILGLVIVRVTFGFAADLVA